MCDSFRRVAPFVEHLRNKKNYCKVTKRKDEITFSEMVSFSDAGG